MSAKSRFRLDAFQWLAIATTAATYFLIAVGAFVRAVGAGLGCPDWPKCFGMWIPPTHADQLPPGWDKSLFDPILTWVEYVNRLVGASTGILITGAMVLSFVFYRKRPRVWAPTVGAWVLVGIVGWLGAKVVEHDLDSATITLHMLLALFVVSFLLYATVAAFFDGKPLTDRLEGPRRAYARHMAALFGLSTLQVVLGTQLRAAVERVLLATPGLDRAEWLTSLGWWPDKAHRQLAVIITVYAGWLMWRTLKDAEMTRALRIAAVCVFACALGQVLGGLGLAYASFPRTLQVLHVLFGALLLGASTAGWLLCRWLPAAQRDPA